MGINKEMKINTQSLKLFIVLSISCLANVQNPNEASQKTKIRVGESNQDGDAVDALTFGMGTDGGYILQNEKNYRAPELYGRLPKITPISQVRTPKAVAEENPTISVFYDGTNKLNTFKIDCKLYTNPKECMHKSGCGWCGELTRCIKGTQMGPLEKCIKSTFIFTSPDDKQFSKNDNVEMGALIANVQTE